MLWGVGFIHDTKTFAITTFQLWIWYVVSIRKLHLMMYNMIDIMFFLHEDPVNGLLGSCIMWRIIDKEKINMQLMHIWLIINDSIHYLTVQWTSIFFSNFLWWSFSPPPTKSCQQYSNSTPTLDGFVLWSTFHITKLWQGVFTQLASCGQCGTAWMNNVGTTHTNYTIMFP
jgi:hypothetical protein